MRQYVVPALIEAMRIAMFVALAVLLLLGTQAVR
jgi:hypothetical protein